MRYVYEMWWDSRRDSDMRQRENRSNLNVIIWQQMQDEEECTWRRKKPRYKCKINVGFKSNQCNKWVSAVRESNKEERLMNLRVLRLLSPLSVDDCSECATDDAGLFALANRLGIVFWIGANSTELVYYGLSPVVAWDWGREALTLRREEVFFLLVCLHISWNKWSNLE